jgi:hypothetical protein
VDGECFDIKETEEGCESTYAVNGGQENERSTRVSEKEIVEIRVLVLCENMSVCEQGRPTLSADKQST